MQVTKVGLLLAVLPCHRVLLAPRAYALEGAAATLLSVTA